MSVTQISSDVGGGVEVNQHRCLYVEFGTTSAVLHVVEISKVGFGDIRIRGYTNRSRAVDIVVSDDIAKAIATVRRA